MLCNILMERTGMSFFAEFLLKKQCVAFGGGAVLGSNMIARGNFPLSLFTLYPPSTYYVSYADKFSFLIHRQQM